MRSAARRRLGAAAPRALALGVGVVLGQPAPWAPEVARAGARADGAASAVDCADSGGAAATTASSETVLRASPGLRLVAPDGPVEFGVVFPLQVIRTWPRGMQAAAFDPRTLLPLSVELQDTSKRAQDGDEHEVLAFAARAFVRERVTVTASFEVRDADGNARTVEAEPVTLRVRSSLPEGAPTPPELPGDLLLPPRSASVWWWLGGLGAGVLGFVLWFARRRPAAEPAPAPAAPPPPDPSDEAFARLRELAQRPCATSADAAGVLVEAAGVLRVYVGERFALPALQRTSEELGAAVAGLVAVPDMRSGLSRVLAAADLVKFACHAPAPDDVSPLLAGAETFVRDTTVSREQAGDAVA